MKLKKVIGVLILALIGILLIGTTSTYAANSNYVLGITNVREAQNGKLGGAYEIQVNGLTKKIWKIVSYPTSESTKIDYSNAFYCLRAEHGFMADGISDVSSIKKLYNTRFDMKTQKANVMEKLNSMEVFKVDPTSYNKIMWIVDNMYLPKTDTLEFKEALLRSAGIVTDKLPMEHVRITNDDIEVVQQLAIWYFTNYDLPVTVFIDGVEKTVYNYRNEELPELFFNNWSGKDENYQNFGDLYDDPINESRREGLYRQQECELLYKYFLDNAKTKGNYVSPDTTSPLTLDKSRVTLEGREQDYLIGPFKINKNNDIVYTLKQIGFVDQNEKNFDYNLLDENKAQVANNDIASLYGKDFYISIPLTTKVTSIKFNMSLTYSATNATYYTTEGSSYLQEQPVMLVERTPLNYEDSVTVTMPKPKQFDLSLRKFISAINGIKPSINREPVVDVTNLKNGTATTAIYNHPKTPIAVNVGDIVTYTIRIYNEGEQDGYVSEITDHLPPELEFLPEDEENIANGWVYDENDVDLRTIKTTHLSKANDTENLIKAFDGEKLDYKDITIKCKVKEDVVYDQRIVNIADITGFTDKNEKPVVDRDSQQSNVNLPTDENLPFYKEEEINRGDRYIPGQQDDDDFDNVKVIYFDLALRKFITKVDNLNVNNRYPVLSMGEDGNIKYTHTKEPVLVANGNIVTYTIRIYNEGKMDGYAKEITDDLPEGLLYLPDNNTNQEYRWKMIDKDGNQTDDVKKAVKITTDYLSKAQEKEEGANLLKAFDSTLGITDTNPDYRDVKIAFKVTEPNTSDRILINTAEISEDSDKDDKPIDDIDSTPGNNQEGEDDIDIEKVKVKYFDLALKKWVTQAIVIENGKETITETGHTGNENPEPVVKVDLKAKDLKKVTVKFRYKIKVTNEGQLEGYVKELKDYIPDGLKFDPKDNPKWTQISQKVVVTDQLKDYLLKPGESTTVEIVLTWENSEDNLNLKVNWAEISKDYNEYDDTPDIDSTPDNRKEGEDDIDNAPVILSIKTGEAKLYIGLTSMILVIFAGGVYLIKKYVL